MRKHTRSEAKKWNEKLKSQNQSQSQSQSSDKKGSKSSKSSAQSAKSAKPGKPDKAPVCYMDEIIAFIKKHAQDSGIVYVLSRKEAGGIGAIE